jgi:RNA polymerase primary sigma factor
MIRVPGHTADQIRRVTVTKNELVQQTGEEPTLEQIAARCDMTADKVKKLLALVPETCSLDAPMGEDEGGLGVLLEDIHAPQPQEQLIREELTQTMQTLLSALTERQQQVLRLRFGMDDGICRSFEQIGTQLGISKERARQIERQAMQRLQEMGADMGLEDFLNE